MKPLRTGAWIAALAAHWRVLLLLSVLVLLPVGRSAELPVLLAAIIALVDFWRANQRRCANGVAANAVPPTIRPTDPALRLALLVFLAYWLPELVSAGDSVVPTKSWSEVALDLRFLPFAMFAISALASSRARWLCLRLAALVIAFWTLDALFQAAVGVGLGGVARGERITGIFGDDNLKLGQVLATLAPILLWAAWRYRRGRWLPVAWSLLTLAIILADRLPHGADAMREILVGNLLAVAWPEIGQTAVLYAVIGIIHFLILFGIGQPERQNTVDDLQCLGAIQRIPTSRHFTLQSINHIKIHPRIHAHQNPKELWREFGKECGTERIHQFRWPFSPRGCAREAKSPTVSLVELCVASVETIVSIRFNLSTILSMDA